MSFFHSLNHLENLPFINNSAKRTIYQTHPTGNTFVIVDFCSSILVRTDGINAASRRTRAFLVDNRIIGTYIDTSAALNTFILIDDRTSIDHMNGIFRAYFCTGMRQTALTSIGCQNFIFWTRMTSKFDDINQRWIVILTCNGTFFDPIRNRGRLCCCSHRQTNGKTQPFPNDSTFQKNAFSVRCQFTRQNFKW